MGNYELFKELKYGNIEEFFIKYPHFKKIISNNKSLKDQFKSIVNLRKDTINSDFINEILESDSDSCSDIEIIYEKKDWIDIEIIEEKANTSMNNSLSDKDDAEYSLKTNKSKASGSSDNINKDKNKNNNSFEPLSPTKNNERIHYRKYLLHILKLLEIDPNKINNLLDDYDKEIINKFRNYSTQAQEFYTRMLKRKFRWLNKSSVKMPDFNKSEIMDIISFLESEGFIRKDINNESLEVILNLLQSPQLKSLCKEFKLKNSLKKENLILNLLKQQNEYKSITNYFSKNNACNSPLKQKAIELLGDVFILNEKPLKVFYRAILLTSFTHHIRTSNDDVSITPERIQTELLKLHNYINSFEKFPKVGVNIVMSPFMDREAFINYEKSLQIHDQMKNFDKINASEEALKLILEIKEKFIKIVNNEKLKKYMLSLPIYLRKYSEGAEYGYILFRYGIKFLKKQGPLNCEYPLLLLLLLNQDIFLNSRKNQLYDELLLYWSKGKQFDQLVNELIKAGNDPNLNVIQKQVLFINWQERLLKNRNINQETKLLLKENWVLNTINFQKVPERIFKALIMADGRPGSKAVYKRYNSNAQETTFLGVEGFALSEYKFTLNFDGKHCEINGVRTLFAFFFWDIIYESSYEDVYHSELQQQPLDLTTNEFYEKRKNEIDERLKLMETWTITETRHIVQSRYEEIKDTTSLVDWRLFESPNEITMILECMGMKVFSKICERLAKYYHDVTSGFPDLLLYNFEKKECKFVEVKGPRDTLSPKQILWLQYLLTISATCEICYIETNEGLKRKRKDD